MKQEAKKLRNDYLKKIELIKQGGVENPLESNDEKQARIEKAKKDPAFFVAYYLSHYASANSADFQIKLAKQTKRNKTAKIIVRWGRGLAKSVWCDVIIPLWLWIQDEIHYMVIVGNNLDKAKILLSDLQAEFEANPRLKHDFGEQQMHGDWETGYFKTKSGFIAKALGMGQSPRGLRLQHQRPDFIVADDLEDKDIVRNPARQDMIVEWIEQDLLPTMDGPVRRYLHPNNNYAPRTIQEELRTRHPDWKVSRVDAYNAVTYKPAWPQKYSKSYYKSIEKEIGVLAAKAEYNNQPHIKGKIFKQEQIQWAKLPALHHFKLIVGHWDVAYAGSPTSDYNAVRVWGLYKDDFYYIDSFVQQTQMRLALEWMVQFQQQIPESVIIHWRFESQFWNGEVKRTIQEVEDQYGVMLNLVKVDTPKHKKYDRILSMQPFYQNSRVYYNYNKKAHQDTQIGLQQLYSIEPGYKTHDDAPDADQQAIEFLSRHIGNMRRTPRMGKYKKNSKRSLI